MGVPYGHVIIQMSWGNDDVAVKSAAEETVTLPARFLSEFKSRW